jgi:predicted aldo/keto reductase-like oxidoreductase
MKTQIPNDRMEMFDDIHKEIDEQMTKLEADYK